jgi:hypothetical protein
MATTRLRKAFRYPDESGDEQGRGELDEEGLFCVFSSSYVLFTDRLLEQELVIRQLQAQNDKRNSEYTVKTPLSCGHCQRRNHS